MKLTIYCIALWAWILFAMTFGYYDAMPGIVASTPDAQSYITYAPFRLPVYGWIANFFGPQILVFLQGIAFALSAMFVTAATRRYYAGLLFIANVGLMAIAFHALTESFAVLAVSIGIWAYDRKKWAVLVTAAVAFMVLRPIIPMPTEAFRQMSVINHDRFMAHVTPYVGSMGQAVAMWWVWINDVKDLFSQSNFVPPKLLAYTLSYTLGLWTLFVANIPRADKWPVLFVAGMVAIGGLTYFQGDRILLPVVPVMIYVICGRKR